MKNILILGGTRFVGRNIVEKLMELGKYNITLFNRGESSPDLFPNIRIIHGDRKKINDIKRISSMDWDIVIDVSGYWAGAFEQQIALQRGTIGRYIYISTSSHYKFDKLNPHLIKEYEDLVPCTQEQKNSGNPAFYNQNKAECERILQKQKGLDYIILRPGLIIGKYDYTDRLYYWFHKLKNQNDILICNNGENVLSYTNVLDLADLVIQSIEIEHSCEVYNASSFITSLKNIMDIASKKLGIEVALISASSKFLDKNNVKQWTDLPLWLDGDFLTTDNSKIIADYNFTFRNVDETIEQLLRYYSKIRKWEEPKTEPSPIDTLKELELIQKVKATYNKV
ncbi:NAD-dependent epimerase/dehydratase family protein [Ulvibacterium sp.]|uniref:NAD-dependent epimerase/dehydratase family protein n=1 Tax=Ulvibacterium sp. TaxID=2665914 RepID=UPI00262C7911|nr:NAD-dependent epimerase/dehydratase family protein [Ulvibacterium sp.]